MGDRVRGMLISGMSRRRAITPLAVAIALLGVTDTASAVQQVQPGVFVDPNSASGKEYAIPLDTARRHGSGASVDTGGPSGGGASGRPSAGGVPLFGVGISPASTRTSGTPAGTGVPDAAGARLPLAAERGTGGEGSTSTTPLMVALVIAMLGAGAAVGVGWRRRSRR